MQLWETFRHTVQTARMGLSAITLLCFAALLPFSRLGGRDDHSGEFFFYKAKISAKHEEKRDWIQIILGSNILNNIWKDLIHWYYLFNTLIVSLFLTGQQGQIPLKVTVTNKFANTKVSYPTACDGGNADVWGLK